MSLAVDRLYQGDCVELLDQFDDGVVDLAFADPPFNIGYKYDVYDDSRSVDDYLAWCRIWMEGIHRVLKPEGSFWLAIGDEFAAELKVLAQRELGFHTRSWVIWYYTFGVNCKRGFSRSHTHLLHFCKDPKRFTFNADHPAERIPSARQLVYGDARANPAGRLPDNTWILRPQDAPDGAFSTDHDTWYYPRVAGTFKEREGFHGCQMPERLLGRIVRLCSNPGELVLDPFGGSGTTLAVAKKLGRRWVGFELSQEYAERIQTRLAAAQDGDDLDGVEDPLSSAPKTREGKVRTVGGPTIGTGNRHGGSKAKRGSTSKKEGSGFAHDAEAGAAEGGSSESGEAHERNATPVAADPVDATVMAQVEDLLGDLSPEVALLDSAANAEFLAKCGERRILLPVHRLNRVLWDTALMQLAGRGRSLAMRRGLRMSGSSLDQATPAAEVAAAVTLRETDRSLADVFCRPEVTPFFDRWSRSLASDLTDLERRWAAWCLMLECRREGMAGRATSGEVSRLPDVLSFEDEIDASLAPGVFVLVDERHQALLVGATWELAGHLSRWRSEPAWQQLGAAGYRWIPIGEPGPLARRLRQTLRPVWGLGMNPARIAPVLM